jgi:geranylgeranyl diphosphate synthase type II
LLDVYGNAKVFGKNIGGDILCNKKTYMLIKALEHANADQHNQLNSWINAETFQPAEKIAAVTELYDRIGVKAVCENKILEYSNRAMESLAAVSIAEEKTEKDNRKFDTQRSLTVLFCNYAL